MELLTLNIDGDMMYSTKCTGYKYRMSIRHALSIKHQGGEEMITTVTLNPAIDKIVELKEVSLGEVHRISDQVVSLGGKSINVSRILSGLEVKTQAICFVGKDNFSQIANHAEDEGLHIEPLIVNGLTRTNVKIVESSMNFRTTDINEIGFSITSKELDQMTERILIAGRQSDFVVLSGSLPAGVPNDYYKVLGKMLKPYTKVVIDADEEVLRLACDSSPYLIKPNIHELEAAYNVTLKTHKQIISLCRKLIELHSITYIIVSMGSEGSLLVASDIALFAEVLKVNVVSTVGAGDSMLAGLLYGLENGQADDHLGTLKQTLTYGTACGAIAIQTKKHTIITEKELIETSKQVTINVY